MPRLYVLRDEARSARLTQLNPQALLSGATGWLESTGHYAFQMGWDVKSLTAHNLMRCEVWQRFKCGCERDGVELSGAHVKSDEQSTADKVGGNHHYPKGFEPKRWCVAHGSQRPCQCDAPKKKLKDVLKKGVKR